MNDAGRRRLFALINGALLIAAGLMVFAFVARIPLREVWKHGDVQGLATAALGIVLGVVLVRSGFLVRRRGRPAEKKKRK